MKETQSATKVLPRRRFRRSQTVKIIGVAIVLTVVLILCCVSVLAIARSRASSTDGDLESQESPLVLNTLGTGVPENSADLPTAESLNPETAARPNTDISQPPIHLTDTSPVGQQNPSTAECLLRITLRSESGQYQKEVAIELNSGSTGRSHTFEAPWTEASTERIAVVDVELPAGSYSLNLHAADLFLKWRGLTKEVVLSAGKMQLDFTCEDLTNTIDYYLDTRDFAPNSDGLCVEFVARVYDGSLQLFSGAGKLDPMVALLESYPRSEVVEWAVGFCGQAAWMGNEEEANDVLINGNTSRVIATEAPNGWALKIVCVDDEYVALPGIRAIVDGTRQYVSDRRGVILIAEPQKPRKVEIVEDGVVLPPGMGEIDLSSWIIVVTVAR